MSEVRIVGNDVIISVDEVVANIENAALIEDNKRLQAENEQLRRERDFYFQQVTENGERAHGAIDALEAENAKLRELVRDIADHIKHDDGFGIDRGWVLDRIRELGIEVDA